MTVRIIVHDWPTIGAALSVIIAIVGLLWMALPHDIGNPLAGLSGADEIALHYNHR